MAERRNALLDLSNTIDSVEVLDRLYIASVGKGEGRIKCTLTKHRIAKTAIVLGVQILLKRTPSSILGIIEKRAPLKTRGQSRPHRKAVRTHLVLECASTQGLLEGVDRVWKMTNGTISHRRVMKASLCLGLESLARVDHAKVRQLVSKVCPIQKKYWDPEVGGWL